MPLSKRMTALEISAEEIGGSRKEKRKQKERKNKRKKKEENKKTREPAPKDTYVLQIVFVLFAPSFQVKVFVSFSLFSPVNTVIYLKSVRSCMMWSSTIEKSQSVKFSFYVTYY